MKDTGHHEDSQSDAGAGVSAAAALVGGGLIGASATLLLAVSGHTAGVSGIVAGAVQSRGDDGRWRWVFLAGLLAGALALRVLAPSTVAPPGTPLPLALLSGVLVGVGTRLGNGCTSGHGVCGISRGSPRSFAATATFMVTGALATALVYHGLGVAR